MFENVKADFARYRQFGYTESYFKLFLEHQGLWALVCYRVGVHLYKNPLPPVLRQLASVLYFLWWKGVQVTTGIEMSPAADIGPGLFIGHFGQIFIGSHAELGASCNISQGVSIGRSKRGQKWGIPKIGNRVYLAPGCKVVGPITLADGVVVGANAVMSRDAPEDTVWAGIPARVIAHTGSAQYMGGADEEQE